jgi:hypothetical protein
MQKIPDLSEHFVYFNDDFYIINNITQDRFFTNGLPNDIAVFRTNFGLSQFERMLSNNIRLINKFFDKKTVMKADYAKWHDPSYGKRARLNYALSCYNKFITLRTPHNAQPYLKATFEDVWEHCNTELTAMSSHRFRKGDDYTPELFRTWQICKSNFMPFNTYKDTKMFPLVFKSDKAIKAIREQSFSLVCLNDNIHIKDFNKTMSEIQSAFESILPEKSSFEM